MLVATPADVPPEESHQSGKQLSQTENHRQLTPRQKPWPARKLRITAKDERAAQEERTWQGRTAKTDPMLPEHGVDIEDY